MFTGWPRTATGTISMRVHTNQRGDGMAGTTVAKKKMGRPQTSERQDVSIKFDRTLAGKARAIAIGRGITMAAYLSDMTRPVIDRDYAKLMRDLESGQ